MKLIKINLVKERKGRVVLAINPILGINLVKGGIEHMKILLIIRSPMTTKELHTLS